MSLPKQNPLWWCMTHAAVGTNSPLNALAPGLEAHVLS